MATKDEYAQPVLGTEQVLNELQDCSPLQVSKRLINMELHDRRDSLEVMAKIYDEFDQGGNVTVELVKPLLLNMCDGLLSIKKLGLKKRGITATRLVNEINSFDYFNSAETKKDQYLEKQRLDADTASHRDDKGSYTRNKKDAAADTPDNYMEDVGKKTNYTKAYFASQHDKQEKLTVYSELEINGMGERKQLRRNSKEYKARLEAKGLNGVERTYNADHNLPLKHLFDEYKGSKALSVGDLRDAAGSVDNFDIISQKLNKIKLDSSWTELKQKRDTLKAKPKLSSAEKQTLASLETHVNDATWNKALARETEARTAVEAHLNMKVATKLTSDSKLVKGAATDAGKKAKDELIDAGVGELVILVVKTVSFELKDMFQNGITHGTDCSSSLEAFSFRMKRALKYITTNLLNIGLGSFKDAAANFVKYLLNAIVDMFVGILKKALKVITEGFNAILASIKILMGESSPAEKADAITKLLATTVVTYIGFAFEESVLGFINKLPFGDVLSDAVMVMFTGIASTVVVWLLDKMDLFSVKDEKRAARVKEIFDMRILQIKENTDAFETAALQTLANNKLQFRQIADSMSMAIDDDKNVNGSVYAMADFMKIELEIKTTDDFMTLLGSQERLVVG
ncbi:DNA repair protein [Shewanella canadensis]|uniref:DNA repair protein n=1 Tax=Shewanella canadensis TaxID=271096 RepID=A0A3S0KXD2_9GAMM|nr:DNA repair protein [Shewanella canadensis]RTR39749.1 DNA repair protein [Shewanella canadensis]